MREAALAAIAAAADLDAAQAGAAPSTPATGRRWPWPTARSARCRRRPARTPAGGSARPGARSTRPSRERQAELEVEAEAADAGRGDRRRHAARGTGAPGVPATPITMHVRAHRRRVRGDGLGGRRGAARRGRVAQLRRAQPRSRPPGAHHAGHVLDRAGRAPPRAAHPHQPGAGAHHADPHATDLRRLSRPRLPHRRVRRHAQPDVPPGRGTRHRRGHHAWPTSRAPLDHFAEAMFGDGHHAPASVRRTSPSPSRRAEVDLRCFVCRGQSPAVEDVPHLQGRGLDRVGRLRRGQPAGAHRLRRRHRALHRLRVRHGHRPHPDVPPRRRGHARHVRGRRPFLHRVRK